MKIKILLMLSLIIAVLAIGTSSIIDIVAQNANKSKTSKKKNETVVLRAATGGAGRGGEKDPNIKEDEKPNNRNVKITPPAAKGNTTRGAAGGCKVALDNSTEWRVKVYVDGVYRGTLGSWDDSYLYVAPGLTTVYARADFEDKSFLYWGPKQYDCKSGQYINFKMIE